jgi:hypothetical protein
VRGKIKWPEKARRRRSPNRVCCGGGGSNSGGFDEAPAVSHGQEARGGRGWLLDCDLRRGAVWGIMF